MLVVSKHFEGREFAKLETTDLFTALEAMRDWMLHALEDTRFSLHVKVLSPISTASPLSQETIPCAIPSSPALLLRHSS